MLMGYLIWSGDQSHFLHRSQLRSYCTQVFNEVKAILLLFLESPSSYVLVWSSRPIVLNKMYIKPSRHITISESISFVSSIARSSSSCKLKYKYRRTTATRNFYYNKVVHLWNSLSPIDFSLSFNKISVHFISANSCTFHYVCACSTCHLTKPAL